MYWWKLKISQRYGFAEGCIRWKSNKKQEEEAQKDEKKKKNTQ